MSRSEIYLWVHPNNFIYTLMKKLITEDNRKQLYISNDIQKKRPTQDDIELIISVAKPGISECYPHSIKLSKRQVKKLIKELTEFL